MNRKPASTVLDIALFGGFCIRYGRGQSLELPGRKDRALIGFLAVSPGVQYSREKLAGLLWGESGERQARDSLKQAILRLRRSLGPASTMPLVANRQFVTLDPESVAVDVGLFERLLSEGTAEALERAIALYRGDLLEGVQVRDAAYEDWLSAERQRLRILTVEASARLMDQSLAAGQRDRAAAAARRLLSLDPLHEAACRTLMQAHAERGERAQALKLFERLRDRLGGELSVAPEPDTVRLYDELRGRRATPAGQRQEGEPQPAPPERPSIAVLPFSNIGDDAEQQYFADGLTEDITTDLSRISGLFVASRHSALAYGGNQVQQAARDLKVSHVVLGSVRKAANRVRITAQLIDGATGGHLWARRYDRHLDDIFALQDEIAQSIADTLKVQLLPEERLSGTIHSTTNVQAYQYYLLGRSFYLRGLDQHSLRMAREMFAKAIEIDPGYARAYAAIAMCESHLTIGDLEVTQESFLHHCRRALELGPHLAEAFVLKGLSQYVAGRYTVAAPEFERAIQLDPELFEANFFYGRNHLLQGHHARAAELFKRAAALRANDYRTPGLLGKCCKAMGDRDGLMAAARQCLQRVETEIEVHPDNAGALAYGSAALADLGQAAQAEDWAERAVLIAPDDCVTRYSIARTYAILGKPDAAQVSLERAFASSEAWQRRLFRWMQHDEDMRPLRSHPKSRDFVRRLEARLGSTAGGVKRGTAAGAAVPGGSRDAEEGLACWGAGQIRISVHPAFAARWLVHRLHRFREVWPECEVVLDATPRLVDFVREGADAAIRRGPGEWPGLMQELLVRSHVFPVAAPGFAPQRAALRPDDVAELALLHDDDGSLWRSWFAAAGITDVDVERGPRILESGLAIEAAVAGQGVALADHFLVADDLARGRLVKLCDHAVPDWDYYLVSLGSAPANPSAAVFRDWLLQDTEALRRDGPSP